MTSVLVPNPQWEYHSSSRFDQDCVVCRHMMYKGQPVHFMKKKPAEFDRLVALHPICKQRLMGQRDIQPALFDMLKEDGIQ